MPLKDTAETIKSTLTVPIIKMRKLQYIFAEFRSSTNQIHWSALFWTIFYNESVFISVFLHNLPIHCDYIQRVSDYMFKKTQRWMEQTSYNINSALNYTFWLLHKLSCRRNASSWFWGMFTLKNLTHQNVVYAYYCWQ